MDPISRRHLWDLIASVKQKCAIVLTTHSMEEADILGDRIGIMARGQLRCLGSGLHLKQRFGSGYRLSIQVQQVCVDPCHPKYGVTDSLGCQNMSNEQMVS